MSFKKMVAKLPPRHWALFGHPATGKSRFATQMASPMVVVDADHRFGEVLKFVKGDAFDLSDDASDNVDPARIALLLQQNMRGSGVKTVVVDSLTAIIAPLVSSAIMANDAGQNKNQVAAFKSKALAMRLIQDAVTGYGCDTLWIYHLRDGRDAKAAAIESSSISITEIARLRRSLNMQLRVLVDGERYGVKVEWCRSGRSGSTLWDDSKTWAGMPERIEHECYGGLTVEDMERIADEKPRTFSSKENAIAWGFEQGCFRDAVHAQNAYEKVKAEKKPKTPQEMFPLWIGDVDRRVKEIENGGTIEQEAAHADNPFNAEPVAA